MLTTSLVLFATAVTLVTTTPSTPITASTEPSWSTDVSLGIWAPLANRRIPGTSGTIKQYDYNLVPVSIEVMAHQTEEAGSGLYFGLRFDWVGYLRTISTTESVACFDERCGSYKSTKTFYSDYFTLRTSAGYQWNNGTVIYGIGPEIGFGLSVMNHVENARKELPIGGTAHLGLDLSFRPMLTLSLYELMPLYDTSFSSEAQGAIRLAVAIP